MANKENNPICELLISYHNLNWIPSSNQDQQFRVELEIDIVERVRCGRAVRSCTVCLSVLPDCLSALRHLSVSLKPLSSCWAACSSIHLMSYSHTACSHTRSCSTFNTSFDCRRSHSDPYFITRDSAWVRVTVNSYLCSEKGWEII